MAETAITAADIVNIRWIIVGAFLAIFLPAIGSAVRSLFSKQKLEKQKQAGASAILVFSGYLLLAIGLLRYAVGYFTIVSQDPESGTLTLTKVEQAMDSLFVALRTFGLEEEYESYILSIRQMLDGVLPPDMRYGTCVRNIVVGYATILNLAAPVAGGALILEVLASIFPVVRLRWTYGQHWREKCYFNELSPASLALAKSLNTYYVKVLHKSKPVLIFTDVYVDKEEEKEFELLMEAKQLGAICVRSDLVHVSKPRIGKRNYYLMEENEFGNMQTLTGLTEGKNVKYLKKSNIYLFVQSDAYVQIEQQVEEKLKDKGLTGEKRPLIVPVNAYRNLVHNLLVDMPLYEPLVHSEDPTELTVTILGNGQIGTESFLGVYWFGQMLNGKNGDPCKLCVNVVSKDTPEVFWSKIDYINPEIKATVQVRGENEEKVHLRYNAAGQQTSPYCTVNYMQADVKIGSFWNPKGGSTASLMASDYFIVALGNDADNISAAQKLRSFIGQKHWQSQSNAKTVLAYAVFDPELAGVLNEKTDSQKADKTADVYMYAFGNLDQVYSCNNVFMANSLVLAAETGNAYQKHSQRDAHLQENRNRRKDENKNYSYWANIARTMHIKYKVYSLGWITTSVFDTGAAIHREAVRELCADYRRIASLDTDAVLNPADTAKRKIMEDRKHLLAWIEHRRWTAFTRTMGYQSTDALKKNLATYASHKNMPLKLHPCLVEAKMPAQKESYITGSFKPNGKLDAETSILAKTVPNADKLDKLDKLTYDWVQLITESQKSKNADLAKKANSVWCYDFKMYDYYRYEFEDNTLFSQFAAWNGEDTPRVPQLRRAKLARLCKRGQKRGIVSYAAQQGADWVIPTALLRQRIARHYVPAKGEAQRKLCRQGKISGAFCFDETWYATRKAWAAERNEKNV